MNIYILKTGLLAAMLTIGSGRVWIAAQTPYAFTTIDVPSAAPGSGQGTSAYHMCGTNIVGSYRDTNLVYHGFLYSPGTWTTLSHPSAGAADGQGTWAFRIAGTNIVGGFVDAAWNARGFLYDGNSWTTLDHPQSVGVSVFTGIDGANIVGHFGDANGVVHGYVLSLLTTNWRTLDHPLARHGPGAGTVVWDISGTNIVGWYADGNNVTHGFLYNGITWQTLDAPGATLTASYGISGLNIVGEYSDSSGITHAYLYNLLPREWITIDEPLGTSTVAYGVYGNNVLGGYLDLGGHGHGFLVTPIPALTIEQSSNGPKISWPYCPLVSWTLEQTADLTTANWTPLGGISNDGTNNFISVTPSGGNAWFRLRQ